MIHRFSIIERAKSFGFAFRGIALTVQSQHNAWIHLFVTAAVTLAGWYCELSAHDWLWLITAITLVWAMETVNTAIERLADAAVPEIHPLIAQAKDAAAGAVLIAVLGSALIGLIVLGPPLIAKFSSGG
ncbi:MAG: diacylglycerol kinase family protein [Myxococcota bacterium]|jgi:diacylglycerol kinase (ATP)|nr:diacylglycerol kinase family protein [Myxococcota bacterium]